MFHSPKLRLLLQFCAGFAAIYGFSLLLSQAQDALIEANLPVGWSILRPPHEVSALALDGENIWAGGRDGLFLIERRNAKFLELPQGSPRFSYVTDILKDRRGRLWIASNEGARCLSNGTWRTLGSSDGAPDGPAKSLLQDSTGFVWIGFETGVLKYSEDDHQFFDKNSGLGIHSVDEIMEDGTGGLWFGSSSPTQGGLSRFDGERWTHYLVNDHLPHPTVNALHEDRSGTIWVGTGFSRRGGVGLFSQGNWRQLDVDDGLAGEKVRSFFEDERGRMWVGSEYDGIVVFDGENRRVLTPEDGLAGWEVKEMVEDSDGVLWMGTEDGISRIETLGQTVSLNGATQ